jgi:nucleoside-diphosphate kinase
MRYSFGILKPDCIRRNLVEEAQRLVLVSGLQIVFSKKRRLERPDVEFLYSRCRNSDFFGNLIRFMISGDVVTYVVESRDGSCAIRTLNEVTGHTNPENAQPGSLRHLGVNVCENIAHSTMDEGSFWAEIRYFLTEEELALLKLES